MKLETESYSFRTVQSETFKNYLKEVNEPKISFVLFFLFLYAIEQACFIYELGKEVAVTLNPPKSQRLYRGIKRVVIL